MRSTSLAFSAVLSIIVIILLFSSVIAVSDGTVSLGSPCSPESSICENGAQCYGFLTERAKCGNYGAYCDSDDQCASRKCRSSYNYALDTDQFPNTCSSAARKDFPLSWIEAEVAMLNEGHKLVRSFGCATCTQKKHADTGRVPFTGGRTGEYCTQDSHCAGKCFKSDPEDKFGYCIDEGDPKASSKTDGRGGTDQFSSGTTVKLEL